MLGRWDKVSEFVHEPGGPVQRSQGVAEIRNLHDRWVVIEHNGNHFGSPFTGMLMVGVNAEKKHYPSVWIDTLSTEVARYQASIDEDAKTLRLDTQIPNPQQAGAMIDIQEQLVIESPDRMVWTTLAGQGDQQVAIVTVRFTRQSNR